MNKTLICTDILYDDKTPELLDKYCDWEWWRPTRRVKREIFSDGTVRQWYEYRNEAGECKYINGYMQYKVDVETRLV